MSKNKRKRITRRDVLDGRAPGAPLLTRGAEDAEGWLSNGRWLVHRDTHDPGGVLGDLEITHEGPVPMAKAVASYGDRALRYMRTPLLVERQDGVLLRLYRGPENAWLMMPEHHVRFALADAALVWAPAPSEPGQMTRAFAGLEPGTGLCAGAMTANGLGEDDLADAAALARDVRPFVPPAKGARP